MKKLIKFELLKILTKRFALISIAAVLFLAVLAKTSCASLWIAASLNIYRMETVV